MRKDIKFIIISLTVISIVNGFYDENSAVIKLTQKNFKQKVLQSDEFWFVQFYAPWCGHCKKIAPEVVKAAEILNGIVHVGGVDMTTDSAAGRKYNINGYPTLKLFGSNKQAPLSYDKSGRQFNDFVQYCMQHVKTEINKRKKDVLATDQL